MNAQYIVDKFGGQTALAKSLGIRQSAVSYWVKRGIVPQKWHEQIIAIAGKDGIDISQAHKMEEVGAVEVHQLSSLPVAEYQGRVDEGAIASPFLFYASDGDAVKVGVLLGEETVWATQQGIADIFDTTKQNVSYHFSNIFKELELHESAVVKEILTTAGDGKAYRTKFYNLDAIISVGYRVSSYKATQFRRWATTVLKEYLIKGYALDDERLKQGNQLFGKDYFNELLERIREIRASERLFYQKITDIYAQCSVDYDKDSPTTHQFYARVQDKLHYAIHGHTSAELIDSRADSGKPNMGLTSWKNEPKGGKITKLDVTVGKNYLSKEEIDELNRVVTMYLDFAENTARRGKMMYMKDWIERLDGFLRFNEYGVLENFGRVRRDTAERHAYAEFEKFRVIQDREFKSDFDKVVDEIKIKGRLPSKKEQGDN
ncbi:virulence RhuM family protein [Oxalobacter vibrioformis]|uniref:Virulence RhuM family protein n=1 Tax=Oxalobacter vibrioformis TaxID=933080 RepID=A0A9E9P3Q3_9BURK|nr:RhuM family protein [Oxalobacter vibrioformis]WAW11232.1 virulence RhuM family protein [Oxalobacter vibrioformis]